MSTEPFTAAANLDTPSNVVVPPGWSSLLIWALGRLGPAVVIAIGVAVACGAALTQVYRDNTALIARMMTDSEARTVVDTQHIEVLRTMQGALERIAGSTNTSAVNSTGKGPSNQ